MTSDAERQLRAQAVDQLRRLMPEARIVHEIKVDMGTCVADVAAIAPEQLIIVEIKSRKDNLERLPKQTRIFSPACHRMVVCFASERWNYPTIQEASNYSCQLWPDDNRDLWKIDIAFTPPNTSAMLNLMWTDELRAEAVRAGLWPEPGLSKPELMKQLWEQLTGAEVSRAVCRQLRARKFKYADPPIPLGRAASEVA